MYHIQILVILVGIVLVLELYWNGCFEYVHCIGIGIGPNRPALFNSAQYPGSAAQYPEDEDRAICER
jgi:hypothetical protein